MKANRNLTISSDLVKLVPYREEHVPKYHSWMVGGIFTRTGAELPSAAVSPASLLEPLPSETGLLLSMRHDDVPSVWQENVELREATASERLSMEVTGRRLHGSLNFVEWQPLRTLCALIQPSRCLLVFQAAPGPAASCRRSMRCSAAGQRIRTVSP